MGLDMYLSAKLYCGDWNHSDADDRNRYRAVTKAVGLDGFRLDGAPSADLSLNVAYWRKANAIHSWFVKNVQDGDDECQESYVSREQLQELVAECRKVLDSIETVEGDIHTGTSYYPDGRVERHVKRGEVVAQQGIAAATLPTQSGFFFGSTDYDEYYLADLRKTVEMLSRVLSDERFNNWTFSYRASW